MIIPKTSIHITGGLINSQLYNLMDAKAKLFKQHRMKDAPFSEVVGYLTGFEFMITDKDCGGYCDTCNRIIALNNSVDEKEVRTKNFDLRLPQRVWNKQTIMHEIGHALQAELGAMAKDNWLLSYKVNMEWQAESISYHLFNKCYGKLDYRFFNAYFDKNDIEFLKKWYGEWVENDLSQNKSIN